MILHKTSMLLAAAATTASTTVTTILSLLTSKTLMYIQKGKIVDIEFQMYMDGQTNPATLSS